MESSLLATKLFIPRVRTGIVPRPRLLRLLDRSLECPLTLVSAPAGFGKSTILTQWISQHVPPLAAAWVSLDASDSDPVRFWEYFIGALKQFRSGVGESALTMLRAPDLYPVESMLTALINDVSGFSEESVVVLDDYHLIQSESVDHGMAFLLDHLPPRMHLVVATREDPALPLAHFMGRGMMLVVDAGNLRFTLDEAVELFKGLAISPEDVGTLNDKTEGWVVGLRLAALSLDQSPDAKAFIATFTGSQRYVVDYLAEEVLRRQPREVRDFLLKTSVLDRLTAPLCDFVIDGTGSQGMLTRIERSNLFLIPLDDSRGWYRYYHLFAELLNNELELTFGRDQVALLRQRASSWCEHNGLKDDGIRYALAGKDWEKAAELITGVADSRLARGEDLTLLSWIRALPPDVLDGSLDLQRWYSRALVRTGQLEEAEAALSSLQKASQMDVDLQGEIAAQQARVARRRGDDARATQLATGALTLLPSDRLAYRAWASQTLGRSRCDVGLFDEAWDLFTDAFEMGKQAADYLAAADAVTYLAFISFNRGMLDESARLSEETIALAGQSPVAGLGHLRLGQVMYERNDLIGAAQHHQLAAGLSELRGFPGNVATSYLVLARTNLAKGDLAGAAAAVSKANSLMNHPDIRQRVSAFCIAFQGLLALRREDLDSAAFWSDRLANHVQVLPFNFRHYPARLMIATGKKELARGQLAGLYKGAVKARANALVAQIRVYQALAAETQAEALSFVAEALRVGQPSGLIRTFADEGKSLLPILRRALAQGVTPEYTSKLLAVIENEGPQQRRGDGSGAWDPVTRSLISERELEVLRLLADGLSNQQIADKLVVSMNTTKTHVRHLSEKLGANDRHQAVTRARELRLI